jgi:hypothetical protein
MIRVFGFEGTRPDDANIAWGAAALLVKPDTLLNAHSRLTVPLADLSKTDATESVVALPDDVVVSEDDAASDITVAAIRRSEHSHLFLVRKNTQSGEIARRIRGQTTFYVFATKADFAAYADRVAGQVIVELLKKEPDAREVQQRLIYDALVLAPHHPHLHALRTLTAPDIKATERLARASLRSDSDREAFRQFLEALTADSIDYRMKYEGGIAAGQGLDIEDAVQQFGALKTVISKGLIPHLRKVIPFLRTDEVELPMQRVLLHAGSAEIIFSVNVKDESRLRRVARYLELQYLQDALQGNLPATFPHDSTFLQAFEQVLQPTVDTVLTHKPFGAVDFEDVVIQPFVSTGIREDAPFEILGAPQGASSELKRIDIKFFPFMREAVSLEDDGSGSPGLGRHHFRERNDFLFRPFVFKVQRISDSTHRHRFFLLSSRLLDVNVPDRITAIPSTVVPGAYLIDLDLPIVVSEGGLTIGNDYIGETPESPSFNTWESFLHEYGQWCQNYEFTRGATADAKWLPPSKAKPPTKTIRVLMVLAELGEAAVPLSQVRNVLRKRRTHEREPRLGLGAIRREVEHSRFFETQQYEEELLVKMTADGARLLSIYRKAMTGSQA